MNLRRRITPIAPLVLMLIAACVTVNVYFPAAEIKDLSKRIEEEVRKEAAKNSAQSPEGNVPAPAPEPNAPSGNPPKSEGSLSLLDAVLGVTPAYAAAGDSVGTPEVTSPAIRKIISSRAARVDALNALKAAGVIGENNQALLEIRNLAALTDLKARADAQRLVKAENADREELFREIAIAKNVDAAQIPKIRETYASTLRDLARPGDWIQTPDGTWKQK